MTSVEIRDIAIPAALQDAISRQAQAEREKQARAILGSAAAAIAGSLGACRRHHQFRLLNIVLALAIAGGARAVPSMSEGGPLYAPCVPCHQPNAWGSPDGSIPNLAGQQPHYLEKQLTAFRSGARDSTAMQIVAVHPTFSDRRNIRVLAGYLTGLEANPNPVIGSGEHLRVGQELYAHICASCHGISGRGQPGTGVPRIAGQHYPYLRRQIEAAAVLHKELAPPQMLSAIRSMRPQEKDALADYISRLGNSEALLDSNRPDGTDTHPPAPLR